MSDPEETKVAEPQEPPVADPELPDDEAHKEPSQEPPQEPNEYEQFLSELGVDPENPATVAGVLKEMKEQLDQQRETLDTYAAALQELGAQRAQPQPQLQPQMPMGMGADPQDAWSRFYEQDPYQVIQGLAAQTAQEMIINDTVKAEKFRLQKEYGLNPLEANAIESAAHQLVQTNPLKYRGKPLQIAIQEAFQEAAKMMGKGPKPAPKTSAARAASMVNAPTANRKPETKNVGLEAKLEELTRKKDEATAKGQALNAAQYLLEIADLERKMGG